MADDTNQLRVRLVTPERILFERTADAIELPAKNGYIEVLYGHAPLLAELGAGEVRLHGPGSGGEEIYNVSWGFVEVLPDREMDLGHVDPDAWIAVSREVGPAGIRYDVEVRPS